MWHHGCRGRETKFSWRRAEHRFVRVRVRADLRISRLATHVRTILTRVLRQVSRLSVGFFFGQGRPRAPVSAGAVGVPDVFPSPALFGRHNAVLFCNLVGALETVNVAPRPAAPRLRQAEVVPVVCRSPLIRRPGKHAESLFLAVLLTTEMPMHHVRLVPIARNIPPNCKQFSSSSPRVRLCLESGVCLHVCE